MDIPAMRKSFRLLFCPSVIFEISRTTGGYGIRFNAAISTAQESKGIK